MLERYWHTAVWCRERKCTIVGLRAKQGFPVRQQHCWWNSLSHWNTDFTPIANVHFLCFVWLAIRVSLLVICCDSLNIADSSASASVWWEKDWCQSWMCMWVLSTICSSMAWLWQLSWQVTLLSWHDVSLYCHLSECQWVLCDMVRGSMAWSYRGESLYWHVLYILCTI